MCNFGVYALCALHFDMFKVTIYVDIVVPNVDVLLSFCDFVVVRVSKSLHDIFVAVASRHCVKHYFVVALFTFNLLIAI